MIGTLTLVYDHHVHELGDALTGIQHQHHAAILSTLHIHLDAHLCLEVLVLRGAVPVINENDTISVEEITPLSSLRAGITSTVYPNSKPISARRAALPSRPLPNAKS